MKLFRWLNGKVARHLRTFEMTGVLMRIFSFSLVSWLGPDSPFLFVWALEHCRCSLALLVPGRSSNETQPTRCSMYSGSGLGLWGWCGRLDSHILDGPACPELSGTMKNCGPPTGSLFVESEAKGRTIVLWPIKRTSAWRRISEHAARSLAAFVLTTLTASVRGDGASAVAALEKLGAVAHSATRKLQGALWSIQVVLTGGKVTDVALKDLKRTQATHSSVTSMPARQ